MKKILSTLFLTLIYINLFAGSSFYDENTATHSFFNNYKDSIDEENYIKVYLSPSQISIFDEGIYVDFEMSSYPVLVENLFYDEGGVFTFLGKSNPDCGHSPYCNRCGGCNPNNRCQSRCKCGPYPYDRR